MKQKKIELILFLFGLYMVFYGLIKRVILDFGVDIFYKFNYFFYPVFVVTFGLIIIIKSKKMNVTMSIFCLFYGIFLLLLIVSDNFWASLLSFFTTYYVFFLFAVFYWLAKLGVDLISVYRSMFIFSFPFVVIYGGVQFVYGHLPWDLTWVNNSWSSLYVANADGDGVLRIYSVFEGPLYMAIFFVFGLLSIYLQPMRNCFMSFFIWVISLCMIFLAIKSSVLLASIISLFLVIIFKRNSLVKILPGIVFLMTVFLSFIGFVVRNNNELISDFVFDNLGVNYLTQRLALGTFNARFIKYEELIGSANSLIYGNGPSYISMANRFFDDGFVDSDSQIVTLWLNFGIIAVVLYIYSFCQFIKVSARIKRNRYRFLSFVPIFILMMSLYTEILGLRLPMYAAFMFIGSIYYGECERSHFFTPSERKD